MSTKSRWVLWCILSLLIFWLWGFWTAEAATREVIDTGSGRVIRNAPCLLVVDDTVMHKPCSISRIEGTPSTAVIFGDARFFIKRMDEQGTAAIILLEPDGSTRVIASVVAVGSCWIGHKIKFCAE